MAITRETVHHVARLARLELDDEEVARMQRDLSSILEYVDALSELDTSAVEETAHAAVEAAPLRNDVRVAGVPTDLALSQAPRSTGGGFAVPAFVEE
jgi:aspartyl-tRNA(Asn)/glutamyl-tRNA(Gln) amidotransferase subunit C